MKQDNKEGRRYVIIKESDIVITHSGVIGMKWGIRKERYEQTRQKATNIVSQNKGSKSMNTQDLAAAEWMSKSIPDKVASEIFKSTIGIAAGYILTGQTDKLKDPAIIAKTAARILKSTATSAALKEVAYTRAINKRYKSTGEKDLSVKQYRRESLTPEGMIMKGTRVAMAISPIISAVAKQKLGTIAKNRYETNSRMEKWGPNLLDKKTSDVHTIYDDGYMSVLEKIKKG